MNKLTVKKINVQAAPEAAAVPSLLNQESIPFHTIDIVNWPDFPYAPQVKFRIAHTGNAILLHYKVQEKSVRAVAGHDNGRVWEDACVEFFTMPQGDGIYYNFECNCAGNLLIEGGAPGNREHAPLELVATVDRWASLGRTAFEERIGDCEWELALVIPVKAFFKHNIADLTGLSVRANFYKCGDLLQTPHFLSWSPINLPKPCFHCPEFFGEAVFE